MAKYTIELDSLIFNSDAFTEEDDYEQAFEFEIDADDIEQAVKKMKKALTDSFGISYGNV